MVETLESKALTLTENFQRYFSVKFAVTPKQKQQVYHIRYRVYCDEFGYEPADRFPDEMERDSYDEHALHCLIVHRSGMPAGCVRLVPAHGDSSKFPLPFEQFCGESLDQGFIDSLGLERNSVCEISRLAVDGAFRRRSGEALTRFGEVDAMDCSRQEQRTFSLIAVAGFLAATALTELTGRTSVFAMMEPFLPRLLKRSGILFQRAGRDINYHGIRAPYFITTQSALDNMRSDLKELYDAILKQIETSYRKSL
jgi:N-acyl amino acid synthase of PEP-CTERM/exosortase system